MSAERCVLPTNVRPIHYVLDLRVDLDNATFTAHVRITVAIADATTTFVLNAAGLDFSETSLYRCDPNRWVAVEEVGVLSAVSSAEDQRLTITAAAEVEKAAELRFSYTATISDNLFGFYRSHYTFEGAKKYVGATQLCPAEARRVFPCWDEPAIKTTFELTITVPNSLQVWSNDFPSNTTEPVDATHTRWNFKIGSPMSTYLLAWVIGEMDTADMPILMPCNAPQVGICCKPAPLHVRAITPRGKIEQASFAVQVASRVLPLYQEYFDFQYPFRKLDLVALPNFAFGAMENWGCVTFREQAMLAAADASSTQKERVAIVVTHELAHQWFGNLVTMAWWSDLWLNESFATYLATWAVHQLFPEWVVDRQFVHDEGRRAFQLDALRSSHPIELPVHDVREVDGIFDAISYSKGAMVLRMTAKFIGEESFRHGLRDYIARYAYRSAKSEQLWECLSGSAAPNLKEVLRSWTQAQGYPYVQASFDAATQALTLVQRRFLVVNDATPEEDATLWQIPMYYTYGTADGTVKTVPVVLTDRTTTIRVPGATWVKVNTDQIAFCRVQYTEAMLQSLEAPLLRKSITGTDRYSLIADLEAFARGGYCETVQALQLLAHYHAEDDYTVWCEVADFEKKLRSIIQGGCGAAAAEVMAAFNAYCQRLYEPAMKRVGFDAAAASEEQYRTQQTRVLLFSRLLACGDVSAAAHAHALYEKGAVPTDMVGAVFAARIRGGDGAALAEAKQLAVEAPFAETRTQYLTALSAVSDPITGVPDLMEYLLSDAVPSQDMATVLLGLSERPDTQRLFAEQIIAQWPRLAAKVPSLMLARLLKFVESGCDREVAARLQEFFAALPAEMQSRTRMTFHQGVESLLCNAAWAERDAASTAEYLRSL